MKSVTNYADLVKMMSDDYLFFASGVINPNNQDYLERENFTPDFTDVYFNEYEQEKGNKCLREEYLSKQKLDKKCSVENIVVSSGSTAVLYASFKYIYERRQKKIVFVAPCWSMYEVIAKNLGITYDYCFPTNKMTWKHTLEDICNVLDESVGAIVVANPGNPTGLMFSEEYLQAVYRRCVELDIDMILDEAYYGLSDQMNRFTQINCAQDNLIIIRTMSKYYCLSGARVGFAISSFKYIEGLANNIKAMNLVGSKIDQFVALQYLKQDVIKKINNGYIYQNYRKFKKLSDTYQDFEVIQPEGGFFLVFKIRNGGNNVADELCKKGLIFRDGKIFNMDGYLRVNLSETKKNINELILRLSQYLEEKERN